MKINLVVSLAHTLLRRRGVRHVTCSFTKNIHSFNFLCVKILISELCFDVSSFKFHATSNFTGLIATLVENVFKNKESRKLCRGMHALNTSVEWPESPTHVCKKPWHMQESSLLRFVKCPVLLSSRKISCSAVVFKKKRKKEDIEIKEEGEDEDEQVEQLLKELEEESLTRRKYRVPGIGYNVFVIQPNIKWGPKKKVNTTTELQLDEAVGLVHTLPGWKVVKKSVLPVFNPYKKHIFGSGNLEELRRSVKQHSAVDAVFVSIDLMSGLQHSELQKILGVPVFDRYDIVLQIFRNHASTKEAKLQVSLAEVPLLRSRLFELKEKGKDRESGAMQYIGGAGESYFEIRKRMLNEQEMKIKNALTKVRKQRQLRRKNRLQKQIPIIAVVGYTNAGKTSLIKALSGDETLEPKDQMFATLDITAHAGFLPCGQKVLFMDTVGFISDIPTGLVEAFAATLEDVTISNLIIHVRDISHPDTKAQNDVVKETLQSLHLPPMLFETMVEVGNKVDLIQSTDVPPIDHGLHLVSMKNGKGMKCLVREVQQKLLQNTGLFFCKLRIPMGGIETSWLYKEAGIKSAVADSTDPSFLILEVVISEGKLAKFKHHFGDLVYEN
ncbi:putative GTP-binding protein 6 [Tachypleus tridentatus]|uniref:putative GTP-binding protein 6 n=1 Tax=Tachypleus tridentatus TaxID=6853 RepID=UPI003FD4B172